MTPTPTAQESRTLGEGIQRPPSESIVISGMSGVYPQAYSVKELSDILYNKVNPVAIEKKLWKWSHPEAPEYMGNVPNVHLFDSRFFMVHHHLANSMEPMARKLLEHAYQAIYDAGISPKQLNGKKIGVYIAAALSDTERDGVIDKLSSTGFGITGCSKTMYANRISYWLNAKGPSITVDDACCGFTVALEQAYHAMNEGICEGAIVGGANLCLYPHAQVHYDRCIKMSPDARTKSFDKDANGCVKSEALTVIFLQKAQDALRAYAELVHVKNEFISKLSGETGQMFGFIRDPNDTADFLKQFYYEANTFPETVEYIEAFGSATPEADKAELEAIEKVFCDNRADPLFVGSVISNVGYTEAATGGTAITKVLLGFHNSLVASNLHCDTPRQDVAAMRDGRMCVLREHLPFRGSLAALNCLSLTGVNSHVLLRGCTNIKDRTRYTTSIPRLVNVSARQEEHVGTIFEDLKSRPIDPEELALLHNIHSLDISGHLGRGYIILDTNKQQETISISEEKKYFDDTQRPLWFVYSGMGSQWVGMGAQLMRIPIFAAAIERCRKVLEPKGIDIVYIINSTDKTVFDNIMNSFVGIAAIQIGLTDVLMALGLYPDKIIGHSVGELGCAYADGCLTAEEMIQSAYSRGRASIETPLIRGAMAAVGLGYTQLSKRCPPEIEIACHNGPESSTISGPEEILRKFVSSLADEGIFAKEVPCSNIAYHSRYIADAGPRLLQLLSEMEIKPRARSARWLSTSVPPERWDEPIAQYCSAEYLTNNLLSPVYFEETCSLIESNAVLVEVAPHGLLQAILRRALPQTCTNIPLAQRNHPDNVHCLLEAIGKLFVAGYTPRVQAIYPKINFPVSTGTPHLAHLVKWNHTESWKVRTINEDARTTASSCKFLITTHDDDHSYLTGNIINGKVLYPFAGTLVAVWDTLAMAIGKPKKQVSIQFNDVYLYSQPILHTQKSLKLSVSIQKGSGWFEVLDGKSKVATGYIYTIQKAGQVKSDEICHKLSISSNDIYGHFSDRGYSYRDEFRSIESVDESLSVAQLAWNNNWVTMIDGLLQLNALRHTHDGVSQPTHIRNIIIDVRKHFQHLTDEATSATATVDDVLDYTRCGGIMLLNIKFRNIPRLIQEKFKVIPVLSCNASVMNTVSENNEMLTPKNIALDMSVAGDFNTLHWKEAPMEQDSGIIVVIEYAGINMSDVHRATKTISFDDTKHFGMDFSGLTESGARVMGIGVAGSARSVVRARSELLWPVPAHWSLEDAATVPLAYLQAYYCLCVRNMIRLGSRVLIHGGAGALGQAAISVALAHGYQVFTTVADTSKKRFLLKLFPQLKEDAIFNSRDASFGDMVLNATNGEGCDIVISCVRGHLKNISLKCAAHSGVTFDTAQIQSRDQFEYGMSYMTKSRSYVAIDFNTMFEDGNTELLQRLQLLLSDGISRGEVRPLSRVCYWGREATRAFRLLAASRHRGRVLLRLRDSMHPTHNSFICSPEGTHLIIWDGSSLGLQFCNRLIRRGVRKLRLHCPKSSTNHQIKLRLWQEMGIDVQIQEDCSTEDDDKITKMLNDANQCGPVQGIYMIAVKDKNFSDVLPHVVDNLDSASRTTCPNLKYFGVITMDNNFEHTHRACVSRCMDGYPGTALILPSSVISGEDTSSWTIAAVDAMEQALKSDVPIQIAQLQTIQRPSLVKLIEDIVGVGHETLEYNTLQDLGLAVESVTLIKSFLNDVYQVSIDDEDLLKITKKRINKMELNYAEHNLKEKSGLDTFFNHVDRDELCATASFIPMNTLVYEVKSMEDCIDIKDDNQLFVIPGLEGHYARFRTLCAHLKLPAFVLQPGLDRPHETPRELALRYAELLLDKFKLKKKFFILGYECGILVALELAGILEDNGLTGTLFCIGDGPEEMKTMLEEQLVEFRSEEMLQSGVVRHMFSLMADGSPAPLSIEDFLSWGERVEACVRALVGRVSHSAQYIRALVEAAYARISTVRRYTAAPRTLRSRLVVLRARRAAASREHCSLQRYSPRPLPLRQLAASMHRAATDLHAPAIINSYLDDDILSQFKVTNLCHTY